MRPFDFLAFASRIYRERPRAHRQRYLLPALYGGEGRRFEAVVVLESPSVKFTEDHWLNCNSLEQAIECHRQIFLDWASRGNQAMLFDILHSSVPMSEKSRAGTRERTPLFERLYVTDIWKDAGFGIADRGHEYRDYWLSKLAMELGGVLARRVIFVGSEAALGARYVRRGTPIHYLPFPSWRIPKLRFAQLIAELAAEIRKPAISSGPHGARMYD